MAGTNRADGQALPGHRRRWRFYRTAAGGEPVRDFLDDERLSDADAATIAAVMKEVRDMAAPTGMLTILGEAFGKSRLMARRSLTG